MKTLSSSLASRLSFIEAKKPTNKVPNARKHISETEKAKEEVDYVLSIERAVDRAEFRRLPDDEALPQDPKLWPARAARERAQFERDIWVSELLPPTPGARPGARRASLHPAHPFHNVTKTNIAFEKRLAEALDEEALDPTLYDNYDDDLKLVRDLKDRIGEKVLISWRKRIRFRPPADMLRFARGPQTPAYHQLEVPVMMTGAMRSLLRRNERELRRMPLAQPDTTPRWQPPPPHAPLPSPSRRRYEFEKWLEQFKHDTPVMAPKTYTINPYVHETWISKLWYYSTPYPARMKMWAYRKMQESVYHVQDWVAILDDVLKKNAGNLKFNLFYTMVVFEALLRDIRLFWTFLRHRFYIGSLMRTEKKRKNWFQWLLSIIFFWIRERSPSHRYIINSIANNITGKPGRKGWNFLGEDRTNDISRHLVYYTMVARRYIDLMGMSEQIMFAYDQRVYNKKKEQAKRREKRRKRARTRTYRTANTGREEDPNMTPPS